MKRKITPGLLFVLGFLYLGTLVNAFPAVDISGDDSLKNKLAKRTQLLPIKKHVLSLKYLYNLPADRSANHDNKGTLGFGLKSGLTSYMNFSILINPISMRPGTDDTFFDYISVCADWLMSHEKHIFPAVLGRNYLVMLKNGRALGFGLALNKHIINLASPFLRFDVQVIGRDFGSLVVNFKTDIGNKMQIWRDLAAEIDIQLTADSYDGSLSDHLPFYNGDSLNISSSAFLFRGGISYTLLETTEFWFKVVLPIAGQTNNLIGPAYIFGTNIEI